MLKRFFLSVVIVMMAYFNLNGQSITIAAAADLRFALDEVVNVYKESNPGIKIDPIYGSSGNLFQQISNQAPFDIFFSADNSYPVKLEEKKLTGSKPKIYAVGHLVMWSATKDVSKGLELLKSDDVKKISIANPEVAPYGKRAVECLNYYKLYDLVKDKIVKGDNVSQAAQF
ncbi:MAG: molybdate ABC transporter substrate-binding protein, partial [Ignavibacteriaceae bacterium]|nr:molybdate ABC transporter substrate-binding protein [Ignavibacteriaceae bacterium]